MHKELSPSWFVLRVLGIDHAEPIGTAEEDGCCQFCGAEIAKGEPIGNTQAPPTWLDAPMKANKRSDMGCTACPVVFDRFFGKGSRCVFSEEGVFPVGKGVDKAAMLLDPPKGPQLWALRNAKKAHVIWKANLTLDPQLIRVQIGNGSSFIRRERLLDIAHRVIEYRKAGGKAPVSFAKTADTFGIGDQHGSLHYQCPPDLASDLMTLTPGELWGLDALTTKANWDWDSLKRPEPLVAEDIRKPVRKSTKQTTKETA